MLLWNRCRKIVTKNVGLTATNLGTIFVAPILSDYLRRARLTALGGQVPGDHMTERYDVILSFCLCVDSLHAKRSILHIYIGNKYKEAISASFLRFEVLLKD